MSEPDARPVPLGMLRIAYRTRFPTSRRQGNGPSSQRKVLSTGIFSRSPPRQNAAAGAPHTTTPGLTMEQLEEGLRTLDRGEVDPNLFWDQNLAAFRETLVFAINETSDALSSQRISPELRDQLQSQVEPLKFYLSMADSYLAGRRDLN